MQDRSALDDRHALARFAGLLADEARRVTLPFAPDMDGCGDKGETLFDPVTEADREAERVMRAAIEARFPDHGISGEEMPPKAGTSGFEWSLDPIDGTRAFLCGLPSWTTLIALLDQGTPVVGVIDVPRLAERYVGIEGAAWVVDGEGERPLRVSACTDPAAARLSTTDPYLFSGAEADGFERLRRRVRLVRYGLDAYAYARLASGTIDLVAESGLRPHDVNALVPVVRGAGGRVGNWRGGDDLSEGQLLAAATPELFDAAVSLLATS